MAKLPKAPQQITKYTELVELLDKLKVVYWFQPESKIWEKQTESLVKSYKIEIILTSNDNTMLDWLFQKAGGEFKKGPDDIIYLSYLFKQ